MSTAINYSALLKRAKQARKTKSEDATSLAGSPWASSAPQLFTQRPDNEKSLVEKYQISPEGLDRAFYVPNFVTEEEQKLVIDKVCPPLWFIPHV